MTITIELKPAIETSAIQQASNIGLSLDDYLAKLLEEAISKRSKEKTNITKQLDEVYSKQTSGFDPVLKKMQAVSLSVEEW